MNTINCPHLSNSESQEKVTEKVLNVAGQCCWMECGVADANKIIVFPADPSS